MKPILDISHHQVPSNMDYTKLARQISFAIVRTQYGSNLIDKYYKQHYANFKKHSVPCAAYAWIRGVSKTDMEKEATDFYNRTKNLNPTFWFLDVEEQSMSDMRAGVKAYAKKLRQLGAKKVGVYIAHHLYKKFNLDVDDFDAVWIPRYGKNEGRPDIKPDFECDLWQYTSQGKLTGYNDNLDLSTLNSVKKLEYFTGGKKHAAEKPKPKHEKVEKYKVIKSVSAFKTAADAKRYKNRAGNVKVGTYYIFNKSDGMINVSSKANVPGSWINPSGNIIPTYVDKRIESKHNGKLRFYNKPSWDDKYVAGTITKGYGFPAIVSKVKVDGAYQYKVKNSKGHVYYITASDKYVKVV